METRLSMPLEPKLDTIPLSSALSQLHIRCVAQILLTPWILRLKRAQL